MHIHTLPDQSKRFHSIDLLRGIIIVIMALDHVRDYFHAGAFLFDPTDLSRTNIPLFFTRWITHFCAPVFTFLAGVSAFLNGTRKTKKELSIFLFTRGLWLVIADVSIITLGWTFNPFFPQIMLAVLSALGVGMMVLSVFIYLPRPLILIIGLALIAGHNLLDLPRTPDQSPSFLMAFLHERHIFDTKPISIFFVYPVLPWIGIMLTGYIVGQLYLPTFDSGKRRKILTGLGLGAIVLFTIIRSINIYGDPNHWSTQKTSLFTLMSFINTSKYPPSLLYILMTLGPAMLFLAFAEKPLNRLTEKFVVFGRVSMFFYILHIYLIHLLAVIAATISGYKWTDMVLTGWVSRNVHLRGYGYGLWVVFVLWIIIVIGTYPLCKWFDEYKRTNRSKWWLSYI